MWKKQGGNASGVVRNLNALKNQQRQDQPVRNRLIKLSGDAATWFRCSGFGFQYCACPVKLAAQRHF